MFPHAKLIVVSDLHLADKGTDPLGIDTTARFSTAVGQINTFHSDAEAVIVAGDISDDGSAYSYDVFLDIVSSLAVPWYAMPGNHDNLAAFERIAQAHAATGRFDRALALSKGAAYMLDTSVDGADHGALNQAQLDWLAGQSFDTPSLVVTHHPAQRLGIWTDRIRLTSADLLADVLGKTVSPPTLLAGHVHMNSAGCWRGISALTLSGNYFSVAPILEDVPPEKGLPVTFFDGPADYAVVLFSDDGVIVHFETYVHGFAAFDGTRIDALMRGGQ